MHAKSLQSCLTLCGPMVYSSPGSSVHGIFQKITTKVPLVKAMVIPVVMYGCESWTVKKAERQSIDAFELLEKTLESPKEIQPVHSEGDQPWDFLGRNDAKAETPVLSPPHSKS